jgi:hypothetical protein
MKQPGEAYIKWLCAFGPLFNKMLAPDGSIVLEMGNSWEPGMPVMSTLALRAEVGPTSAVGIVGDARLHQGAIVQVTA